MDVHPVRVFTANTLMRFMNGVESETHELLVKVEQPKVRNEYDVIGRVLRSNVGVLVGRPQH